MPNTLSFVTDTVINTYKAYHQTASSVAALADGSRVVVWQSDQQDGDGLGAYGQLYGSDGQPVGNEFRVDNDSLGDQHSPSVAALANGNFMVAWYGGNTGNIRELYAQEFTWDGSALSKVGSEITVDNSASPEHGAVISTNYSNPPAVIGLSDGGYAIGWYENSSQVSVSIYDANGTVVRLDSFGVVTAHPTHPSLTELSDGRVLFTWAHYTGSAYYREDAHGRIYNADGTLFKGTFTLNSIPTGYQNNIDVDALPGGGFVATWAVETTTSYTGADSGVYVRVFDANGNASTSDVQVVPVGASQWYKTSSVTALSDSTFVVFWEQTDSDGTGVNIYAQHMDASGNKLAPEFVVNSDTSGTQSLADTTLNADGTITVAFQSFRTETNSFDIMAREIEVSIPVPDVEPPVLNPNPAPVVSNPEQDHLINTYKAYHQTASSVAALADGSRVVVWQSDQQDGDGLGAYGQLYGSDGQPVGNEFRVDNDSLGDQHSPSVAALANGNFMVAWYGGNTGNIRELYAQEFTWDGSALSKVGSEITVDNSASPEHGAVISTNYSNPPAVIGLSDGGYAIGWYENSSQVSVSIYDANGTVVRLDSFGVVTAHPTHPSLTELSDGRVLFTWAHYTGSAYYREDAHGRIYNADGTLFKGTFTLNSIPTGYQNNIDVDALPGGGFVATWAVETTTSYTGADSGVYVRVFDANGNASTSDVQVVPVGASQWYKTSSVTALSDSTFVVFWEQTDSDGTGVNIYAQHMDASGNKLAPEFVVNSDTSGTQSLADTTLNADGTITVAFQSFRTETNSFDIMARVLDFGVSTGTEGTQGNDTLIGGSGNDTIHGEDGDDVIYGRAGADWLFGDVGSDVLHGEDGNDTLFGKAGNDTLNGGAGNDWLDGGDEANVSYGGADNDTLDGGYTGSGSFDGGDGVDTLHLWRHRGGDMAVDLEAGTAQATNGETFTLTSVENALGSDLGNDHISGTNDANYLRGVGGDDTLFGRDGNDTLEGDNGADQLVGGAGNDTLTGGAGADVFVFDATSGTDKVTDFSLSEDRIDLSAMGLTFSEVQISQFGASTVIGDMASGHYIQLVGIDATSLTEEHFILS